ncbi:hypothetical protein F4808DRAFT_472290 [Astrocystis sublimbata]|nr:hypothetical protein F4808DRAFT_472290 [Astrocystis sublimbata]
MAPTIDVIRHAESTHNVSGERFERDPKLTEDGETQAALLGRSYPHIWHDFSGLSEECFTSYGNTSMRSFQFVNLHGIDLEAKMIETEESCQRLKIPRFVDLSEDEKQRLKSYAVARIQLQKEELDSLTRTERDPRKIDGG